MRITGRGHPAIRATHGKTLELTPDETITERATCVIATAVSRPVSALAGPVRLTITAGDERAVVHARANPEWEPGGPAVVRRSPLRLPGTFATDADLAAADLPRALVGALQDPDAVVTIEIERVPEERPTLVLANPATLSRAALRAEAAAAQGVLAEDDAARPFMHDLLVGTPGSGGRSLVLAVDDVPGALQIFDDTRIETLGLPPRLAVAAACPSRAPVAFVHSVRDLADPPAGYRVVLSSTADELPALLRRAADVRGTRVATLAQRQVQPWSHDLAAPLHLPSRGPVACCLHPSDAGLDPRVRAAIVALLADGVPTRAAARALSELTGWPRRRAYDAVLTMGAR